MSIIDIIIIIFLIFGALLGFKRGFTRQLINSLGSIVVLILAFKLKNPVSVILFKILPFFKFDKILKGATVLNIVLYELLAFLIVLFILLFFLRIAMTASKIFEKVLNLTIFLGIISKILGAIVGVITNYVIVFFVLYILTLPIMNVSGVEESIYKDKILTRTPVLSKFAQKSFTVMQDIGDLKNKYKESNNYNQFNLEAIDLLLDKKIVNINTIDDLIENEKLIIDNVEIILKKYR